MEITGCDLVVFSFTTPVEVFARISASVLARWPGALVDDTDGPLTARPVADVAREDLPERDGHLTFLRDVAMVRHMEAAAYSPMADGDGPFAIITRVRRDVEFAVSSLNEVHAEDRGPVSVEPYPAWFCSPTVTEVTAVTPADPGASLFAAWVLAEVKRASRCAV